MAKLATQLLEEEHHLIQQIIGAMAAFADRLQQGEKPFADLLDLVDFMRIFVEKCHHDKEDNYLFPLLVQKGVPVVGCPIGVLSHEHERSRKLTADLCAEVEAFVKKPEMPEALIKSLRSLVELYPNHIWKENYLLFPMADKLLTDAEQQELLEKFKMVECTLTADIRGRFEFLAASMAEQAQQTPEG